MRIKHGQQAKTGGGVLTGAGAQEENLFRRSNLFMSLYQFTQYANEYGIKILTPTELIKLWN
jgi:hypothetical protein